MATLAAAIQGLFGNAFSVSQGFVKDHDGIDLAAPRGTKVRAVASGRVTYARNAGSDSKAGDQWAIGGGNVVNIAIGGKRTTQYAHLDSIGVQAGQYVRKGDVIGTVGSTGKATGSHLHFGLWDHNTNRMINPTGFLTAAAAGWDDGATSSALDTSGDPVYAAALDWAQSQGIAAGTPITADQWSQFVTYYIAKTKQAPGGEVESALRGPVAATWVGKTWGSIGAHQAEFPETSDPLGTIAAVVGKLADPANWIRILALFAGAGIFAFGAYGVLRATGSDQGRRPAKFI